MEAASDSALAAAITRSASRQSYYTVRFLVDRDLVADAYRAYAYFRWVDDWLDRANRPRTECRDFVACQQVLLESLYRGEQPAGLAPQEGLLAELIRRHTEPDSGLGIYLRNMMAVMAFDADRRGRAISQTELDRYTHWLAVAVTEALHYFIGHDCAAPRDETRYMAAAGAHIAHMLRDALKDVDVGYCNIPREVVTSQRISPLDADSKAYRQWVRERVREARACFRAGRAYLARVESLRCRIAGYAYVRRFEVVLDCIELEGFRLREEYPERKRHRAELGILGWALWTALSHRPAAHLSV